MKTTLIADADQISSCNVSFNRQTDEASIGANNARGVFIAAANTGLLGCKMRQVRADMLGFLLLRVHRRPTHNGNVPLESVMNKGINHCRSLTALLR